MYREDFKPLHYMHDVKIEKEEEPQEVPQVPEVVEETVDPCEEIKLLWQAEVDNLKEQIKKLNTQIESLQTERERALEEKSRISKELEERKFLENLIENLSNKIIETFMGVKANIRKDIIELTIELLKKLILTETLPKEDLIIRLLSKVLESGVELKGQITIYLNPKDLHRLSPYTKNLKESIGDEVELSIVPKGDLKEGEFSIETPKLWIERHYDDILQDLLEDLENEGVV